MKIASYNIMSGGFDGYDHSATEPQRLSRIQAVIKDLNADVVGLVDTFRWSEVFTAVELQELFGYEFAYSIQLNDKRLQKIGHDNGLTLLSRAEMTETKTISLGERDAIRAKVKLGGTTVSLFLVYLDDLSEDVRVSQVARLLKHCAKNENTLIIGDLNALASDQPRGLVEAFFSQNPAAEKIRPIMEEMYRAEVVRDLEKHGFVDAGKQAGEPTMPTSLFPGKVGRPFLRVDYCFYSPGLKVRNFKTSSSSATENASDHLPIVFEIE